MNRDFLGVGWNLSMEIDRQGGVKLSGQEANIEQSIRIILGTSKGERIMRPDFGCGINDLVFAPNNTHTHGLVIHYIEEALAKWEPRIELIKVEADADKDYNHKLLINIEYKVISTNNFFNLVYPFYLERSEHDTQAQFR
jgi:phage baseplate assembly protein W